MKLLNVMESKVLFFLAVLGLLNQVPQFSRSKVSDARSAMQGMKVLAAISIDWLISNSGEQCVRKAEFDGGCTTQHLAKPYHPYVFSRGSCWRIQVF